MSEKFETGYEFYTYNAIVRRIVDGDTIDFDVDQGFRDWKHEERFRLAGIDTPEVYGAKACEEGRMASDFVKAKLPVGTRVILVTDKDKRGKYGRWIATVYYLVPPNTPKMEGVTTRVFSLISEGKVVHEATYFNLNQELVVRGIAKQIGPIRE